MNSPPEGSGLGVYADELLRAYMCHSPMLVFVKHADGHYALANPTMERTFGFTLAEMQQRTDVDWLSSASDVHIHDRVALETGRPLETVETVATADGTVRHFMVIRFPFTQNDGGRVVGGVAVDVTELKQAELRVGESERRYRHLVESGQGLIGRTIWKAP